MVSSSLNTLRGIPDQQATVYNNYLKASTQVRTDNYLSGQARLAQIGKLASTAVDDLQGLLDTANASEKKIRSAVVSTQPASDESLARVRWLFDHDMTVQSICLAFVDANDRDGFIALRQMLPYLARMEALPGPKNNVAKCIAEANTLIALHEKHVLTPQEQALFAEVQECDISMGLLRQNHTQLQGFMQGQFQASAVAGQFTRMMKIWHWQGLPGDNLPKGSIVLSDDFGGQYKASPTITR